MPIRTSYSEIVTYCDLDTSDFGSQLCQQIRNCSRLDAVSHQRGYALLHSCAILDASESTATPAKRPEAFSSFILETAALGSYCRRSRHEDGSERCGEGTGTIPRCDQVQLHLIATHRPAHLQHEYATILIQVGDVMPVKSFPAMWETATMIMLGNISKEKYGWKVPAMYLVQKHVARISTSSKMDTWSLRTTSFLL